MARKKTLGDKPSKVVYENILKETPDYDAVLPSDAEIVITNHVPEYRKVVFVNQRDPGCELTFHYRTATHPTKHYTLFHGMEYDLPVEVIEHLEECGRLIYGEEKIVNGIMERPILGKKYHFSFRSPNSKQKVA